CWSSNAAGQGPAGVSPASARAGAGRSARTRASRSPPARAAGKLRPPEMLAGHALPRGTLLRRRRSRPPTLTCVPTCIATTCARPSHRQPAPSRAAARAHQIEPLPLPAEKAKVEKIRQYQLRR
ncbi:unnamed protein product, partial [Urochloa humidicola]